MVPSHLHDQLRSESWEYTAVFIQSWFFPNHLIQPTPDVPSVAALFNRMVRPTLYIGATLEMLPRRENRVALAENQINLVLL
jgi:hypothetical protein